jgi:hypothetical protein
MKNFKLLTLLFCLCSSVNAQVSPMPEADHLTIEYESVSKALAALKANKNIDISVQGGWTIAYDEANHTLWSFAPTEHPAYPSAVKRAVVEKDGIVSIKMDVHCQSTKEPCDQLVRDFIKLNEQMKQSFQK